MTIKDSEEPVHPHSKARVLVYPCLDNLEAVEDTWSEQTDQTTEMCSLTSESSLVAQVLL